MGGQIEGFPGLQDFGGKETTGKEGKKENVGKREERDRGGRKVESSFCLLFKTEREDNDLLVASQNMLKVV